MQDTDYLNIFNTTVMTHTQVYVSHCTLDVWLINNKETPMCAVDNVFTK